MTITINSTWTDPSDAGTLDLDTDDQLSETVWDAMMSDIKHLGGTAGYIGCRVYHNANQSINDSTATKLAFNSERFDSNAFHDTVTNNSRLTVPTGYAGKYLIFGSVRWAADADGRRQLSIYLNGATALAGNDGASTGAVVFHQSIATVYDLAVGDYIEFDVWHNAGAALNVDAAGNFSPEFGMVKI